MSDIYKRMRQVVEEDVVVAKKCDVCQKEIEPTPLPPVGYKENIPFFEITTGHHDWGNDSIDSVEIKHACSPECLMEFVGKYINVNFKGIHTDYINIEHKNAWYRSKEAKE